MVLLSQLSFCASTGISETKNRSSYLDSSYLDHEHGSSQHMPSVVAPELDSSHLLDLVEVDGLNLIHALLQVSLRVQHVICRNVAAINQQQNYCRYY